MIEHKGNATQPCIKFRMEYTVPLAAAFFIVWFSMWTLGVHFATFLNVPWVYFCGISKFLTFVAPWIAYMIAARFATSYSNSVLTVS